MTLPPPRRSRPRRRGPGLAALVVALFVLLLAELAVLLAVARAIGGWPTVGLLVLETLFGAWLIKREGRTAWRALIKALRTGRMPARELADGALILFGGMLLLIPGFLTDLAGLFVVAPLTRPAARTMLARAVDRRLLAGGWRHGPFAAGRSLGGGPRVGGSGPEPPAGGPRPEGPDVIPGEIR